MFFHHTGTLKVSLQDLLLFKTFRNVKRGLILPLIKSVSHLSEPSLYPMW